RRDACPPRHARACPAHPRLASLAKTWMGARVPRAERARAALMHRGRLRAGGGERGQELVLDLLLDHLQPALGAAGALVHVIELGRLPADGLVGAVPGARERVGRLALDAGELALKLADAVVGYARGAVLILRGLRADAVDLGLHQLDPLGGG